MDKPGGWDSLDLTPGQYIVLTALWLAALSISPHATSVRLTTRDVCKFYEKLTGIEDRGCKQTSRLLNELSRRLTLDNRRVIERDHGAKKMYWRCEPELIRRVLIEAEVRQDWRGRISEEVFYSLFYPRATELVEKFKASRSLLESMRRGERGSQYVYCLDRSVVESARGKGREVGEMCVVSGEVYFDNVQYRDVDGSVKRGEVGVVSLDKIFKRVREGAKVLSAEIEMFPPRDSSIGKLAMNFEIYYDKRYGAWKVSGRPHEGFYKYGDERDLIRAEYTFYRDLGLVGLGLLQLFLNSVPRAVQSDVIREYEELLKKFLRELCNSSKALKQICLEIFSELKT